MAVGYATRTLIIFLIIAKFICNNSVWCSGKEQDTLAARNWIKYEYAASQETTSKPSYCQIRKKSSNNNMSKLIGD